MLNRPDPGERLVARVVRDILSQGRFDSIAALKDAVRDRCKALGMSCPIDALDRGLDLVGSNAHLVVVPPAAPSIARPPDPPAINDAEARSILARLAVHLKGVDETPAVIAHPAAPADFPALVPVRA